jgi:hypothetical protein
LRFFKWIQNHIHKTPLQDILKVKYTQ